MKKIIRSIIAGSTLITGSYAQWCVTCDVLPPCTGSELKEVFCGSYDNANPQGCWSYYKRLKVCPQEIGDPVIYGNSYRTEWRLGFTCTGGNDCF